MSLRVLVRGLGHIQVAAYNDDLALVRTDFTKFKVLLVCSAVMVDAGN